MSVDERNHGTHRSRERRAQILGLLGRQASASLTDIQQVTGGSVATTRRDLSELAEEGLIERTRGGARLIPRDSSLDEEFGRRQQRHARAKGEIAKAAAELVPTGASLFLNDGSTTLALAQELTNRDLKLWIATSALNIAELLARNGANEVVVIGGSLRRTSFGTIGPLATNALDQLHADLAFVGCDGIHLEDGPRSNSIYDAEVARTMTTHADRTVLLADASKLGHPSRCLIAPWDQIDHWITDRLEQADQTQADRLPTTVTQVQA
jgi:DeoR/GlpR family transcriptional regulator of sugar metabolism